ncbi:GSCOCG00003263001-RA-CDS [Cotesia congregata]|uniref:tRNA-uridine aminocarboxypropyltransferase 1 n=1 Tax=Cotesia congregata TaxID=51543 RepID=A0A8J2MSY6_COTCN|nr:GSCOCG00003263001-RA-CDS [Cotesia congregata]CAG5108281.1 Similar to Dtwd1: tRNA-uridine aminocarboxypropyltransferase 1 (Rattus norvegicus) [Cotesia congregata]
MTETCKININNTKKLNELENKQRIIDKAPFDHLKIDDPSVLDDVQGREICGKCFKSRKFFCYTCYTPVIDSKYFPRVKVYCKVIFICIDIIKHRKEIEGKSTAIHAAILAPEDVTIYIYPDFPIFTPNDKVVLIFPGKNAISIDDLLSKRLNKENKSDDTETEDDYYPITRAIFIDSTWQQTKSIYKDPRLRELPCVVFSSRISQFWRHQKKSPRWYLATIEAVHTFLVELHTKTYGAIENYNIKQVNTDDEKYSGQYDNLLYIFKYMYHKIHTIYDHDQLRAYKRPLI